MQQPASRRARNPFKRVCTLVIALCVMAVIAPQSSSLAQDVSSQPTAEATSEAVLTTDAPSLSTEVPAATPAAEVLPIVTEAAPIATLEATEEASIVATAEATLEATEEAIVEATAEATLAPLTSFADDFTDWTGEGWDIVEWLVKTETDGSAHLMTTNSVASAVIQNFQPADFQLTARLRVNEQNIAEILVRSGLENYRVMFSAQGASRLYRGETLLAASATAPLATATVIAVDPVATAELVATAEAVATAELAAAPEPTALTTEPQWFTVTITAAGSTIGVSVNGIPQIAYTDPLPLASGMIVFKAGAENTGEIALDDLSVVTVDPLTTVIATPDAVIVVGEPTAQPTAEATLEATAEATLEVTAEATAEPVSLEEATAKLPEMLRGAFALYATGDVVGAAALFEEQGVYPDTENRVYLIVSHDGTEDISALIEEGGGEIVASPGQIYAYIPLDTVLILTNTRAVTSLSLPARAISTGPVATGSLYGGYLESFDALGATDWHNAGIRGQSIRIAVIDTGFALGTTIGGANPAGADFSCLAQATVSGGQNGIPNNNHGRNVIEVLCDIAPNSVVYMYQAADSVTLAERVGQAHSSDVDVILITMDLGASTSAGDGKGITNDENDPYIQIKDAHDAGIIVIAAAGNNGNNTSNLDTGSSYIAYKGGNHSFKVYIPVGSGALHWWIYDPSTTNTTSGSINLTAAGCSGGCTQNVTAPANSIVQVQVMNGHFQFTSGLFSRPTGEIVNAGNLARPADSPDVITVGAVCADYELNYPIHAKSSRGPIYNLKGALPIPALPAIFTVPDPKVTGLTRSQVKPDILSFSNVRTSTATSEPGARCTTGFAGTSAAAAHAAGAVALMLSVSPDYNPSMTADTVTSFNRTQFSNPKTAFTNVLNYLQSHTVEMPFGTGPTTGNSVENPNESDTPTNLVGANGFDMVYGAGLSVLGSPQYDLLQTVNAQIAPEPFTIIGDVCPSFVYVGQGNPGAALMDGTQANPFLHPAYAYNFADADDCIIIMPGEYVSPMLLQPYNIQTAVGNVTPVTGRSIYSYDDVRPEDPAPSIFWMNTQYYNPNLINVDGDMVKVGAKYGTGQIVIDGMLPSSNRTVVSGFIFLTTHMLGTVTAVPLVNTSNDFISEPQGVLVSRSEDVSIRNSSFGEAVLSFFYGEPVAITVTYPGLTNSPLTGVNASMIVAVENSNGLIVEGNRFVNNKIGITGGSRPPVLFVENSGINGTPAQSGYNTKRVRFALNLVQGNSNQRDASFSTWTTILKANLSAIDITDNMFVSNSGETIIQSRTTIPDSDTLTTTDDLETRILGNVFLSNSSLAAPAEGDAGPIVSLYYVRNVYFVNNTVVKNTTSNAKYGSLLLRGTSIISPFETAILGSITNDVHQKWEIHNNIIYGNTLMRGIAEDAVRTKLAGFTQQCDSLNSTVDFSGATYNWVYGNGIDNSACGGAITNSNTQNNVVNVAPEILDLQGNVTQSFFAGFKGLNSPESLNRFTNPIYYALNNRCTVTTPCPLIDPAAPANFDGVDFGSNSVITTPSVLIGSADFNRDVDGGARLVGNPTVIVDRGAFEFETLTFVDAFVTAGATYDVNGPEDAVLVISLDNLTFDDPLVTGSVNPIVTGGSGALSFNIISRPEDYGTHCAGGTFNDQNRGLQVIGKVMKYCPPRNFFTDKPNVGPQGTPDISAIGAPWQDNLTIQFKVRDAAGQETDGTATLKLEITQVNDALLSGSYSYVVSSSRDIVPVQLRPYVTFTPITAANSAFNVAFAPKIGTQVAADFPYTYSNFVWVPVGEDSEDNDLLFTQTELDAAVLQMTPNFNMGYKPGTIFIDLDPSGTGQVGYKAFRYTVTDRNGGAATYKVTLRVASTIPSSGLYDDTSFAFVYDDAVRNDDETLGNNITMGTWETSGADNAINNTLHQTSTLNNQFIVEYKGTGFVLYLRSNGGFSSDFEVGIMQGDLTLDVGEWLEVPFPGGIATTPGLRQAIIYAPDDNNPVTPPVPFGGVCYSRAPGGGLAVDTDPGPGIVNAYPYLNGNALGGGNFTVTCEDMPGVASTYTVLVKHKSTLTRRLLIVDAISILSNTTATETVLTPGYYDVDAKTVRDLFPVPQWKPETSLAGPYTFVFSNLVAMSTSDVNALVTFKVRRATGFAIETILEPKSPIYTICVALEISPNVASDAKSCQRYNNTVAVAPAAQPLVLHVFRPFYGLNPKSNYIVTIDIESLGTTPLAGVSRLVIDSITVFGNDVQPSAELPLRNIDDLSLDLFVLGGGFEDSWAFNGAATTSLNSTLTTSSTLAKGRHVGPFVAFQMPEEADAFILKYTPAPTLSTQWMVCVDRAKFDPLDPTPETKHGNCLVINPQLLNTGLVSTYKRIDQTPGPLLGNLEAADAVDNVMAAGLLQPGVVSNQPLAGTLIIRESMFDADWFAGSHTVEIFSLADAPINFDVITPIDTTNSLQPGYYEEITPGLHYFDTLMAEQAGFDTRITKITPPPLTVPWTLLTLVSYSGSGAVQTKQVNASVAFNMTGATGFAPRIQLSTSTDTLKVCWKSFLNASPVSISPASVTDVLTSGECRFIDTESVSPLYKVDRPFFGFDPTKSYTVVVQSIGDTYTPAPRIAPISLTWDGVTIFGSEYDATTLKLLTDAGDPLHEFNFKNRVADNKFKYFGPKWTTFEGPVAATRSASNYDTALGMGSTVLFKVNSSSSRDTLVFLRETSLSFSDLEVCAINYTNVRTCSVIETNTVAGIKVPALFNLPGSGIYIISVTALSNTTMSLDSVKHVQLGSLTLQPGLYENTDPRLRYGDNAQNLVVNGNMEAPILTTWQPIGYTPLFTPPGYMGTRSLRLSGITPDNSGVKSQPFNLKANTKYTVVGRVMTSAKFSTAAITMQVNGIGVNPSAFATLDISLANTLLPVYTWQPLRIDFTTSAAVSNADVSFLVSKASPTATTYIYIDDVSVVEGSAWDVFPGIAYTGGFMTRSRSHGAEMTFSFTGTGFNVGTVADTLGGKIEICYQPGSAVTDTSATKCMTYVNESPTVSRTLLRGAIGLADIATPYTVRIRDIEEGYQDTIYAPTSFLSRTALNSVGRIGIDFVEIFGTNLPSPIPTSTLINDNAVGSNNQPYIQLLPSNRWRTLTGTLAVGRSGGTVAAQVDPITSAATALDGGTTALFRVTVPASSEANIVVHTGFGGGYSTTIMACVDAVAGNLNYDNVDRRQESDAGQPCTVFTTALNLPFFVLNKSLIPALGTAGLHTVTLRTLTPGFFYIDGVMVLYGNSLMAGYYENTQTATPDLMTVVSGIWTTELSTLHSGGSALVTPNLNITGKLSLKLKDSTGLTVFTAGGPVNRGIKLNVYDVLDTTFSTLLYTKSVPLTPVSGFKVPVTLAGLPKDDYLVTIELYIPPVVFPAILPTTGKVTVDAVEVYGELQILGSLYDDASLNPLDGQPYLTYTPNTNAAWTVVTGPAALSHLDLTYHRTIKLDAGVAFQVDNAKGLILHHGTITNTKIRVCLTPVVGTTQVCTAEPGIVVNAATSRTTMINFSNALFPTAPGGYFTTGDFNVSIVNATVNGTFTLDAVQVEEIGGALAEGIYDAIYLNQKGHLQPGSVVPPTVPWTVPTVGSNMSSGSVGAFVEFTFKGIGFSLVLNESAATAATYSICIEVSDATPTVCETPVTGGLSSLTRGVGGDYALTVTGLHINGADGIYRVRVTNTSTPVPTQKLVVRSLHIMGDRDDMTLTPDDSRVENNDPRLRYLPFSSLTETVIKTVPSPSAFSQHQGTLLREAGVYFEFVGKGFEYGRQTAAQYGAYSYCYGPITTGTTPDYDCKGNATPGAPSGSGSNILSAGMQRVDVIATGNVCDTGCWVRLYSTDTKIFPVDFIRIIDVFNVEPLSAGIYEENHPAFQTVYSNNSGTSYVFNSPLLVVPQIPMPLASGGFVDEFTLPTASDTSTGMAFVFHGTGFGVNFVRNAFSDAVEICYDSISVLPFEEARVVDIVELGDCVIYDNNTPGILYNQVRTTQGLPEDDYGVVVRMLGDNYRAANSLVPLAHAAAQLPIRMLIDNITVFNEPWYPTLNVLTPGKVYEPSYLNRGAQNNFWYNGPWSTIAVTGGFADRVSLSGSTMLFHTSGASGMVLYITSNRASSPIEVCARPIDSTPPAELESGTHCQMLLARSVYPMNRYAVPFRFVDGDTDEYIVSIETLENAIFEIDAVELFNVTSPMQPGVYESSSPSIQYSEFTPVDDVLPNGGFAGAAGQPCAPWTAVKATTPGPLLPTATLASPYTDGVTACYVVTSHAGSGIESPNFNLESGKTYTLLARVYVSLGAVKMKSTAYSGDQTHPDLTIIPQLPGVLNRWYTLRREFTAGSTQASLRFEGVGASSRFFVDGVWLIPQGRGQWEQLDSTLYSGSSAMRSQTPGAQVKFTFFGTGFAVKMPTNPNAGEVQICYGTSTPDQCFLHQQDSAVITYDVSRVVAGLPEATYNVVITEKDDGYSGSAAITTPRLPLGIILDSVTIFGLEALPADITQIGQYEQNARNGNIPYMAKLPTSSWRDFSAITWSGGSASQVTTSAGLLSIVNAGATVVMSLDKTLDKPTVLVYNRITTNQSTTLLICASSAAIRSDLKPDTSGLNGVKWTGTAFQLDPLPLPSSPAKCVIHNLRGSNQIILTGSGTPTQNGADAKVLSALNNDNTYKLITFTTLTPGGFNVDTFEVIAGGVLPAGLYDELKPEAQLNFSNSDGAGQISTAPTCNTRLSWCDLKAPRGVVYYGGSIAITRQTGANLKFLFKGTGFSLISVINTVGADMRICVAPYVGPAAPSPFPAGLERNAVFYGNPPGLNDTWCDVVTTKYNALEWAAKNPDRVFPASPVNEYGFSYYGLPDGEYQVEVRLIDTNMLINDYLAIDAVGVFGGEPALLEADGRFANLFDDRQSQIVYEPTAYWTPVASLTQPPLFKTLMQTAKAGSIVRLRIQGNAVTIYQTMRGDSKRTGIPGNTRDVRVCLMVGDAPVPCEPESMETGERATTSYRQSAVNGASVPILIYGFGPGDHNLIIENRDTRIMTIDAFRVHPEE